MYAPVWFIAVSAIFFNEIRFSYIGNSKSRFEKSSLDFGQIYPLPPLWHRRQESNPHPRFWRPGCCHYTTPAYHDGAVPTHLRATFRLVRRASMPHPEPDQWAHRDSNPILGSFRARSGSPWISVCGRGGQSCIFGWYLPAQQRLILARTQGSYSLYG